MTTDLRGIPCQERLRFFGTIMASISHELNNVFGVINENAGLLADWLDQAERGKPLDPQKLGRLSGTIQKHLKRGQGIVKRMNRFAHTVDEEQRSFDLRELVEALVDLSARFAYRKNVELETELPRDPVEISGNPFTLQHALFQAILLLLGDAQGTDALRIRVEGNEQGPHVVLNGSLAADDETVRAGSAFLETLAGALGGAVEVGRQNGEIRLSLPWRFSG